MQLAQHYHLIFSYFQKKLQDDTGRKIENIVAGTIIEGEADYCTAIRNSLCRRFETSTTVKKDFESKSIIKEEQALFIKSFCDEYNLWVLDLGGKQPHPFSAN